MLSVTAGLYERLIRILHYPFSSHLGPISVSLCPVQSEIKPMLFSRDLFLLSCVLLSTHSPGFSIACHPSPHSGTAPLHHFCPTQCQIHSFRYFFSFLKTSSSHRAQAALNWRSSHLSLPNAGIAHMHTPAQLTSVCSLCHLECSFISTGEKARPSGLGSFPAVLFLLQPKPLGCCIFPH